MHTRSLTIGVDVGGTKVAAGLVDEAGPSLRRTRGPDPVGLPGRRRGRHRGLRRRAARRATQVEAVGIGAAGFVTADRSTVLVAPNLSWRDEPLRDAVAERVGLPVVVENDANAAAWGEYRFGAGRGEHHLVLVTVGTGIGGGIVLDGQLYRGRYGIGGRVRPHAGRARRPPLRLRPARLLGAVLLRPGAAARGAGDRRRAARLRRGGCSSSAAARPRASRRSRSRRPPARVTRRRSTASRRSAAGSGRAWPTSPRVLDPGCSSSAAAWPTPASCCSSRPGGCSPSAHRRRQPAGGRDPPGRARQRRRHGRRGRPRAARRWTARPDALGQ